LRFHITFCYSGFSLYQIDENQRSLVCGRTFHGSVLNHLKPQQLLNFDSNVDPDPAFLFDADLHPASQNDADLDLQHKFNL
jgi:hypothetical protein